MGEIFQNNQIEHLYIHVPFCIKKCDYCSFYSIPFNDNSLNKYVHTLMEEIKLFNKIYKLQLKTIYFGGGTPSLLNYKQINRIIGLFDDSTFEEITMEINPVTITDKFADNLKLTKVNRLSIGAQSFDNKELAYLSRLHDKNGIVKAYDILRGSGYNNISLDLMYGLPFQKIDDVIDSLNKIINLNPEHISLYCLSLDKEVPLAKDVSKLPSDELASDMYDAILERLDKSDYKQYEISNFSKEGYESGHNLCYWDYKKYLGIGASASGYIGDCRYNNIANIDKYEEAISSCRIMQNKVILTDIDNWNEYIMLGLRKTGGIDLEEFRSMFDEDFSKRYQTKIDELKKLKLLDIDNNFVKLKPKSYFVSNEVIQNFMEY